MKMNNISILILLIIMLSTYINISIANDFPYRQKYGDVIPIETQELFMKYNRGDVVIIDVRSNIEYNVIHIIKSINIEFSNINFISKIKKISSDNPGKIIVFYCNGVTCLKSYEATRKSINAGLLNCMVYDAGIPAWVKAYPEKTLLLGKIVKDPKKQIIPTEEFLKKCLDFEQFKEKAKSPDAITVDVRDYIQKYSNIPELDMALPIPLDKFIPNFIERKFNQDKTLMIFDQVGKQVRWLEYYLIENGYRNYYFLKGGATAVLKKQKYK